MSLTRTFAGCIDTPPRKKGELRAEVQEHINVYLDNGGQIIEVPRGMSAKIEGAKRDFKSLPLQISKSG